MDLNYKERKRNKIISLLRNKLAINDLKELQLGKSLIDEDHSEQFLFKDKFTLRGMLG